MTPDLVPGLDIPAERVYVADRFCRECDAPVPNTQSAAIHWSIHQGERYRAYYAERERAWRRALEERRE